MDRPARPTENTQHTIHRAYMLPSFLAIEIIIQISMKSLGHEAGTDTFFFFVD